jgi:hypothetical protein
MENVKIRRFWNDWRIAEVAATSLKGANWWQGEGEPRQFIHARVSCEDIIGGEWSCPTRGDCPHRDVNVLVLKKDNSAAVFRAVEEWASWPHAFA